MNKERLHVHFVGINGSGISGVACIAKNLDYEVSGCDINKTSDYTVQLADNNIQVTEGHDVSHLDKVDMVAVSPALLHRDRYKKIEELKVAKDRDILIKWQEFLGKYVMRNKNVVSICGTHGKTTTTSLMGLILETAEFDPTVLIGGKLDKWHSSFRVGNSDWYLCESDEYDYNFIHYNPKFVVMNNLEMEHPERFSDFEDYKKPFKQFFSTIQKNGIMLLNYDDENVKELVEEFKDEFKKKNIKILGYTLENKKLKKSESHISELKKFKTLESKRSIAVSIDGEEFYSSLFGMHNVKNISAAIGLSKILGIDSNHIQKALDDFGGAKRRMEKISENENITIYSDYGHHHTQLIVTAQALRSFVSEDEKIIAILEPHQISRIKNNFSEYMKGLQIADFGIVNKVFKGREAHLKDLDMAKMTKNVKGVEYIEEYEDIKKKILELMNSKEYKGKRANILVVGAGKSYKLAQYLKSELL